MFDLLPRSAQKPSKNLFLSNLTSRWNTSSRCLPSCTQSTTSLVPTQLIRPSSTRKTSYYPIQIQLSDKVSQISPTTCRSLYLYSSDRIQKGLREDGHRTWGFVIYRCTYKGKSDWDEFMRRLQYTIKEPYLCRNGLDIMESHTLTVFEDPSLFDGATTSAVREHFKKWADIAPQQEQGTARPGLSPRYRYCIHVNDEALDSVVRKVPPPEEESQDNRFGFVNLISKEWKPYSPWDGDELLEDEEEPIEGCTLLDVGWLRVRYDAVLVTHYNSLYSDVPWDYMYRRPPEIRDYY